MNSLVKGIKCIEGSMDSDEEKSIYEAIPKLRGNERNTNKILNEVVHINTGMAEEIRNITTHMNKQHILTSVTCC